MTMNEYINSLKGKSIGVIGIGVSNTPLIRTLLDHGLTDITACDVHSAEDLGETARELKDRGVKLQLGPDYLEKLDFDIIFFSIIHSFTSLIFYHLLCDFHIQIIS